MALGTLSVILETCSDNINMKMSPNLMGDMPSEQIATSECKACALPDQICSKMESCQLQHRALFATSCFWLNRVLEISVLLIYVVIFNFTL